MEVASRIMEPFPLSGPIQNEGGIPVNGAVPPIWSYPKGGVAARIMGPSPPSGSIQIEGGNPDHAPPYPVRF